MGSAREDMEVHNELFYDSSHKPDKDIEIIRRHNKMPQESLIVVTRTWIAMTSEIPDGLSDSEIIEFITETHAPTTQISYEPKSKNDAQKGQ